MMTNRTKGFTLVEILIVVIILGILAAIIIPQFTDASEGAKESSVQSNLMAMKSQFELYKAQHNDDHPCDDGNGAIDTLANITAKLTTKTDETGAAGGDLGPYMQNIPVNSFAPSAAAFSLGTVADCDEANPPSQWIIDLDTGAIFDGTGKAN